MDESADRVTGLSGELVDRLLEAVNSECEDDWAHFGWELVFCVGGKELDDVEPYVPAVTTSAAKLPLVGREEFFRLLRRRLLALIESGVREDFLVRSLRDDLSATLQSRSWPTEPRQQPEADAGRRRGDQALGPRPPMLDRLGADRDVFLERVREAWYREDRWHQRAQLISDRVLARWLDEAAGRAAG